jgi:hypothetical protein
MKIILILSLFNLAFATDLPEFSYNTEIPNTNTYIVENHIEKSNDIQVYGLESNSYHDGQTNYSDKYLKEFHGSLKKYYELIEEMKITGDYYYVDWDKQNEEIINELCDEMYEEMNGIFGLCDVPDPKTFILEILPDGNKITDVKKIIDKSNDVYKITNSEYDN